MTQGRYRRSLDRTGPRASHWEGTGTVWVRLTESSTSSDLVERLKEFSRDLRGSEVVLDFSRTGHLDFRMVPELLGWIDQLESQGIRVYHHGLSQYLGWIIEVSAATEGRRFIEDCRWGGPSAEGFAGFATARGSLRVLAPSLN